MTPEERRAYAAAIDFRRRMIVLAEDAIEPVGRCSGCGRELADHGVTEGCRRCLNRSHGRKKRSPGYRGREVSA